MSATVQMEGLGDFVAQLRRLPDDLAREADVIVEATARDMARRAQAAYPEGPTGNLRRGVTVELNSSRWGTSALVRGRAKHATIFERGTKRRQTSQGGNRGAMPAASREQAFVPKAIMARRRMVAALVGLVRRAGFEVRDA